MWLWWEQPTHHWRNLEVAQQLLASHPGLGAGGHRIFLVLSLYGFECVRLSVGLASKLTVHLPSFDHFWSLFFIPMNETFLWMSVASGYGSRFLLWCWGGTFWIFHFCWQYLSLPLLCPKTNHGSGLAGPYRQSILTATLLQSWHECSLGWGGSGEERCWCFSPSP